MRIEKLEWEKVTTENTNAAYENYLFFNPNGTAAHELDKTGQLQ